MDRTRRTRSAREGGPALRPEECSQRAVRAAVNMAYCNLQTLITLGEFMSHGELMHLQMNLLYIMVDSMGATMNVDPDAVLETAKNYFKRLRWEREEYETNQQPANS